MAKDFVRLKSFSVKEYKFQQAKSGPPGDPGQCLNLSLMWIREQIDATNAVNSGFIVGLQAFKLDPGAEGHTHARNRGPYLDAMSYPQRSRPNCAHIARLLGLTRRQNLEPDDMVEAFDDVEYGVALARLANNLPAGYGVLVSIDVEGNDSDSHAVAMFRSRPRVLRFFDSTIGVYRVNDVGGFVNAWLAAYSAIGWEISPSDTGESPFAVYS
jgi:hypothetical protein